MLIYETLGALKHTCTILSVTHRLAPVVDSDLIVVMDQGTVVETGTHEALIDEGGLYYQLFTQQNGFTISPDGLYAEVTPDRLRNIPLFAQLDGASLALFASQFVSERFEAGQMVIREGEPGDKFYVIVRVENYPSPFQAPTRPLSSRYFAGWRLFRRDRPLGGQSAYGKRACSIVKPLHLS